MLPFHTCDQQGSDPGIILRTALEKPGLGYKSWSEVLATSVRLKLSFYPLSVPPESRATGGWPPA